MPTASIQQTLTLGSHTLTGSTQYTGTTEVVVDETCAANQTTQIDAVGVDLSEFKCAVLMATFTGGGTCSVTSQKAGPLAMTAFTLTSNVPKFFTTSGAGQLLVDGDLTSLSVDTSTITDTSQTVRVQMISLHGTPA